jgi:hypothetical protein
MLQMGATGINLPTNQPDVPAQIGLLGSEL